MSNFKKEEEIVIVVNRKKLFNGEELLFQGSTIDESLVGEIILNIDKHYKTMRRGSTDEINLPKSKNAELNFDYKQPIPYIVIKRGDQVYATERLAGGGESRLHGQIALGAGGHMNALSKEMIESFGTVLKANTERELEEELEIVGQYDIEVIGLINDEENSVGQVHIGILGFLDLEESGEVTVRETEQLAGQWYTLDELKEESTYERLENWGKIVVDLL